MPLPIIEATDSEIAGLPTEVLNTSEQSDTTYENMSATTQKLTYVHRGSSVQSLDLLIIHCFIECIYGGQ